MTPAEGTKPGTEMPEKDIRALWAVDIHSHLGPAHTAFAREVLENGTDAYLGRTMAAAHIGASVNASRMAVIPRGSGHSVAGNLDCLKRIEGIPGAYMWVVVDPHEPESFDQAEELLKHPLALGLKLHPEQHGYKLRECGGAIFEFAARHGAAVLGHSGNACCLPEDYAFFADRFPQLTVIAAHLGFGEDGDYTHQLRAIEMNRAGNLYTDTSSGASLSANLLEYAVGRLGAKRILFGTDNGIYFSPAQRARIDAADLPYADKYNILRGNALRLFPKLADATRIKEDEA